MLPRKYFEHYAVREFYLDNLREIEKQLNALAEEDWEIIAVVPKTIRGYIYGKGAGGGMEETSVGVQHVVVFLKRA